MKFYRQHNANIIESEFLVKAAGYLSSGRKGAQRAKAAAVFPFVIVRHNEYATPIIINHEQIHFRQQLETLFVGAHLIRLIEDVYSWLFLRLNSSERYLYRVLEQEAYRNQENLGYLRKRKPYSFLAYFIDKRRLTFVENEPPRVVVGEKI